MPRQPRHINNHRSANRGRAAVVPDGEVAIALVIAAIPFCLQRRTDLETARAMRKVQNIARDNQAAREKHASFARTSLRNQLSSILMIVGLMDRALSKAETCEDVPARIREKRQYLVRMAGHAADVQYLTVENMDPMLIEQIRQFLRGVEGVNPESGAGSPGYADIKKDITQLTKKLDTVAGDKHHVMR